MTRHEPPAIAILAARVARAYPSLSPYASARIADMLAAIERQTALHARRQCNEQDYQAEDGDFPGHPRFLRARRAIERALAKVESTLREWSDGHGEPGICLVRAPFHVAGGDPRSVEYETGGDPRGSTFKVRLPGEKEMVAV